MELLELNSAIEVKPNYNRNKKESFKGVKLGIKKFTFLRGAFSFDTYRNLKSHSMVI